MLSDWLKRFQLPAPLDRLLADWNEPVEAQDPIDEEDVLSWARDKTLPEGGS